MSLLKLFCNCTLFFPSCSTFYLVLSRQAIDYCPFAVKTKTGGKLQPALYRQFSLSHPFEVTLKNLKSPSGIALAPLFRFFKPPQEREGKAKKCGNNHSILLLGLVSLSSLLYRTLSRAFQTLNKHNV